ncbi:hypothetical protein AHF37_05145 [Paragonimus kellicotti]|nr:hypothetical protein AHF37_05145 [Paragonimus kellicotti]
MTNLRAELVQSEMDEKMLEEAVETTREACDKFDSETDVASYIKKKFDQKYNKTWHCVVGQSYGSYITYEIGHFADFVYGNKAILLYKAG